MLSHSAKVKIFECFVLGFALLAISTEGRSLQRIHKHRDSEILEKLMELEDEREIAAERDALMDYDELPIHNSKRRHHLSEEKVDSDLEEEMRMLGLLERRHSNLREFPSYHRGSHALRKRHNEASDDVAYATMTAAEEELYYKSRARNIHHRSSLDTLKNRRYEVELQNAQNTSLCNYTLVPIPDISEDQSRTPKDLVNVICNHAGSRCRSPGNYCCIQTYSTIDVGYSNGRTELLKIYTGCVCSLRLYGELKPYSPKLPIDD